MSELQVAQSSIVINSSSEVVLRCHRHCLNRDRASSSAISDQDLFRAANQFAIDDGVAKVEREALQSTCIRQQLEVVVLPFLKISGSS